MPKKVTTEDFISKARTVHGDRYDYSKTEYHSAHEKVVIICPKHGEFKMLPSNHLKGQRCPKCSLTRTTEDFIRKSREIFGDRYDYSKAVFRSAQDMITIICPEHGEFQIRACNHIQGHGCAKCSKNKRYTQNSFIDAARKVHGNFYDYSESVYVNAKTLVKIICPKHGEFWQSPASHLKGTHCPHCGGEIGGKKISSNTQEFIRKAKAVHGDKYDFSKAHYTSAAEKVIVICPEHGEFQMTAQNILAGHGCPICAGNIQLNTEEFIKRSNEVHDGIYDYSKSEYVNNHEKVCIICHKKNRYGKEHGAFWQNPASHMKGSGCPRCKSSLLEKRVRTFLGRNDLLYEEQKTFDWLTDIGHMYLDFFIPGRSLAIECQGTQHFVPYDVWGGNESLKEIQRRDILKKQLCEEHGIRVLYFSNLGINYPYPVFEDLNALLQAIKDLDKADPSLWKDPELPFVFED